MSDEPRYFAIAAERSSECPHCPETIQPGEAIVQRAGEHEWCHKGCALEQDQIDEDPAAFTAEIVHERELRHQAEIKANIIRGPVGSKPARRRRKARRRTQVGS